MSYFSTRVEHQLKDGNRYLFHSRSYRRGLPPLDLDCNGAILTVAIYAHPWRKLLAPQRQAWWIAELNMIGSIAFMISALHSVFLPRSGTVEWAWGANFYILVGALCFFEASYLMLPELFGAGRGIEIIKEHAK